MLEMSMGIMNGESRPGPLREINLVLFLDRVQAADAGADEHADFVPVDLLQVEPRVQQSLMGGDDGKLGETICAADLLWGRKCGSGIEVRHFSGNPAVEGGNVEGGDLVDAALAGQHVVPKDIELLSEGGDDAQAR